MNRIVPVLCGLVLLLFSCQKELSLEVPAPARGGLKDSLGSCMPSLVSGVYRANQALNDSHFVDVTVNVVKPGSYTIVTDTINGYSFRGTGVFSATGAVSVRLKGTGRPQADGVDDFTVRFDSTFCFFQVPVVAGAGSGGGGGTSGDYFPLTANSWWSYDDGAGSDTLKTTNVATVTRAGKQYQQFVDVYELGERDTFYYRKDAATGNYYQWQDTGSLGLGALLGIRFPSASFEYVFLKETLTSNSAWTADQPITITGFPATLRFDYKCLNANAAVTVNGKNFTNVYQISLMPQIVAGPAVQPLLSRPTEFWYARGIGLIKIDDEGYQQHIRNWKVN